MSVLPRLPTGLSATQPLPCKFSAQGFPCLLFTSLPLLGFVGKHSCCTNPFYYVILRASSTHLLTFTSFTLMGFLLNLLGFLNPTTTYLPLITTWAYWLLGQPIEFPNSFPRLSQPI